MPRYVAGPPASTPYYADWMDDSPLIPDVSVDDAKPVDTGLISRTGESIYRIPNPIGFGRDKEW